MRNRIIVLFALCFFSGYQIGCASMTPQQEASLRAVATQVEDISLAVGDLAGVVGKHGDLLGENSADVKAVAARVEAGAEAAAVAAREVSDGGIDTTEAILLGVGTLATIIFGPQIGAVVTNLGRAGATIVSNGAKKITVAATTAPAKKK